MAGEIIDVCCLKCGKYLFTEEWGERYTRENDKEDYFWDGLNDDFICNQCYESMKGNSGEQQP